MLAHRVRRGASLQSPQKAGEYLTVRLGHLDYEVFGLILLDKRHRVIECVDLFRGTIDGAHPVRLREVVKLTLEMWRRASFLSRNHPSGVRGEVTRQGDHLPRVKEALAPIDVRLVDPRWVGHTETYSLRPRHGDSCKRDGAHEGGLRRAAQLAMSTVSDIACRN